MSSNIWEDSSATIVQMNKGLVRRVQCFKINEQRSAYVTHLLYAHRFRSSLIIQEIDIINPSEQTFDLDYQQKKQISTCPVTEGQGSAKRIPSAAICRRSQPPLSTMDLYDGL